MKFIFNSESPEFPDFLEKKICYPGNNIEQAINQFFQKKSYSNITDNYLLVYKVFNFNEDTQFNFHKVEFSLSRKRKEFLFSPAIEKKSDFEFFLNCSLREWEKHNLQKVIEGAEILKKKDKTFDLNSFLEDLKSFEKSYFK